MPIRKLPGRAVQTPFELVGKSIKPAVYQDTTVSPSISGGTLNLDLSAANAFDVSLNASVATLNFNNPPASGTGQAFILQLTADGTSRTVAWPGSVKWANGVAPVLTSTAGKVDTFVFYTDDGGSNYFGFITGQNS